MTFNTIEISQQDGRPVELYKFERGAVRWHFTSAAEDFTLGAQVYSAVPIKRSGLEANAGEERGELKIDVTRDNPVADLFRVAAPSDVVGVTVSRIHAGDTDAQILWIGRILSVDWKGIQAQLSCEPASVSMDRNGLRRLYQRQCPHRLYGPACRVNRTLFEIIASLTGVSGSTVYCGAAGSLPAGYLSGGVLEWVSPENVTERRMIVSHAGTALTLTQQIPAMPGNATVTLAPGCNHTLGAGGCGRFDNEENFGGMPFIPTKNPHGGTSIY